MLHEAKFERLAFSLRQPVRQYVENMRTCAGGRLQGITLFGTVLQGALPEGRHRLKSVLVLDQIDLELLRRMAPTGLEFGKLGFAAPLIMTPEYIRASLDSFPLELMEIAEHRLTVWGADYFVDLAFTAADVRLECERELKTVLIAMHQGTLTMVDRRGFIDELQQHAAVTLTRVLRGLLWLKDLREPAFEVKLVEQAEAIIARRLNGLRQALEPNGEHGWPQFCDLYDDVTALRRYIDAA